ncbi:hypothetical protein GCM10010289_74040 [Streptomyces violascens]|uniref:Uncharacterized protein n=1 Tax=Streptomyces violascens TaxID=67381 RepID=A0ABQ3QRQ6_9ACTN|nr:hypothetical protein GCM10010289_74040 [Streptomyces violascens]GHI39949.1 hypothetical protein Sviol_43570 [Streptomyces violascens]
MLVEVRACPICWTQFQVNPQAAARHTYCSPRCKAEAARRRRRERDSANNAVVAEPTRPSLPVTPLAPTAIRNCPHCDKPVTVVALLAIPEAARPTIPSASPDVIPMRRG